MITFRQQHSGRLFSLWDVKHYFAKRLLAVCQCIDDCWTVVITSVESDSPPDFKRMRKSLSAILPELEFLNLPCTAANAKRLLASLEDLVPDQLAISASQLKQLLQDESDATNFFYMEPSKAQYWLNNELAGENVRYQMPKANSELCEAAKCFAVLRYTACVCHLMRAMEHALRLVSKSLGIPDPTRGDRNWAAMLNTIKAESAGATWKANKEFYEKTVAYLEAIRQPLRNATMHVDADYDEESAEEILNAVRAALRQIAVNISEYDWVPTATKK